MQMYLFQRDDVIGYHELAGILIVANSVSEAREYALEYRGDEAEEVWRKLEPVSLGAYPGTIFYDEPFYLIRDYKEG